MRVIVVANQKGGVGKTTFTIQTAFLAAERGLQVLCVDMDPQGNLTKSLQTARDANLASPKTALQSDVDPAHGLTSAWLFAEEEAGLEPLDCGGGIHLIAGNRDLQDVSGSDVDAGMLMRPRQRIAALADRFDLVLIDTPPTIGPLMIGALVAADFWIVPTLLDDYSFDGIGQIMEKIREVRDTLNPGLQEVGVVPNCVDLRRKYDIYALEHLRDELGGTLLSALPRRAAIQAVKSRPVWRGTHGESHLRGATEIRGVCLEVLTRAGLAAVPAPAAAG